MIQTGIKTTFRIILVLVVTSFRDESTLDGPVPIVMIQDILSIGSNGNMAEIVIVQEQRFECHHALDQGWIPKIWFDAKLELEFEQLQLGGEVDIWTRQHFGNGNNKGCRREIVKQFVTIQFQVF